MQAAPSATVPPPPASAPAASSPSRGRRVTDAPTRMFHALFVLSFAGAWLTGDSEHWRAWHVSFGYALVGLLVFRVAYGLVGPRPVRLATLTRRLATLPGWVRSVLQSASWRAMPWRQGQPLVMAVLVAGLLLLAVPLALSGYALWQDWGGEALEDVHEFFANLMLGLALLHLAWLVALSFLRRQNAARPMLGGRVDGPGPDLVVHNRRWLAWLIVLVWAGFLAWRWQAAPDLATQASGCTGQPAVCAFRLAQSRP